VLRKFVLVLVALTLLATGCSGVAGGPRGAAIAECAGTASLDFGCYQRRYRGMVAERGVRAAIRDLTDRRERVGYLRAACHQIMHGIGRQAGGAYGIAAFGLGDDSCSAGFPHGVVEAVMARIGVRRILGGAPGVCASFRRRRSRSLDLYNCVHGIGHGFMALYRGDVFRSLRGCDELPSRWERDNCSGGVFMENLTAMSNPTRPSTFLRPREPLYPCTAVQRRFKRECYLKQTAFAFYVRDSDVAAVFAMCAATADSGFREDCDEGLGGDVSIQANKYVAGETTKRATIRSQCALGLARGRGRASVRACVTGAVGEIVRDGATDETDVAALCASFEEKDLRAACTRAHAETVRDFPAVTGRPGDFAVREPDPVALCVAAFKRRVQ
jgi:hypothetical protein